MWLQATSGAIAAPGLTDRNRAANRRLAALNIADHTVTQACSYTGKEGELPVVEGV